MRLKFSDSLLELTMLTKLLHCSNSDAVQKDLLGLVRKASLDKRLPHHRHQQGDQLFHKLGTRSTFQEVEVKDT